MYAEPLEPRRLLSVTFDGRVWRIDGTQGPDDIQLIVAASPSGSTIELAINGQRIDMNDVLPPDPHGVSWLLPERVLIRGGRAGDSIDVEFQFYFPRLTIMGKGGSDRITLRGTNATALAGPGDDVIRTPLSTAGDTLFGEAGNDLLAFGSSQLPGTAHGGPGNDTLVGGAGADTLFGGPGDDLISGLGANDLLLGGPGNDTLRGGDGDDTLLGGDDDDRLVGGDGDDVLLGGPGDNVLVQDSKPNKPKP